MRNVSFKLRKGKKMYTTVVLMFAVLIASGLFFENSIEKK
jgi:hypothetical protein